MSGKPAAEAPCASYRVKVTAPYRLDLTVAVLRRLSTNLVDRFDGGAYLRALEGPAGPAIVRATQTGPSGIAVEIHGAPGDEARLLALVRRVLAFERDVRGFERAANTIPWLAPLARRMRGVRPPRYPSLWEAAVNAVVFQQISLAAASAILGRLVREFGETVAAPVRSPAHTPEAPSLIAFPSVAALTAASDTRLGRLGLSGNKIETLRRFAAELSGGRLDEVQLESLATPRAVERLCEIKGIGRWTAAVMLLRGLGRLDVFPENDSGVARSLAFLGTVDEGAFARGLESLGIWRGMLYYHLLLARLDAKGELFREEPAWRTRKG